MSAAPYRPSPALLAWARAWERPDPGAAAELAACWNSFVREVGSASGDNGLYNGLPVEARAAVAYSRAAAEARRAYRAAGHGDRSRPRLLREMTDAESEELREKRWLWEWVADWEAENEFAMVAAAAGVFAESKGEPKDAS